MSFRSTLIPDFLKASSPEGLRRLMFMKNTQDGKQYIFQNPQYIYDETRKKYFWFVWFYRDMSADSSAEIKNILDNGGTD